MRFRLGINGGGSEAADGFGRAFQTLGMLPLLQAQAAEEGQRAQADMAMRAAQQRQAEAHAALFQQQARAAQEQQQRGTLGELLKSAALQNGVPLSQVGEASDYLQSGQLAQKYEMPPGAQGPTMPAPQYASPDVGARIMQTLGLTRQALTVGDKSVDNIAQAAGRYQQQGAIRDVMADPTSAGRVGQAFAAVEGKPLIDAIGNTGETVNRFTGEGDIASEGLRALFGNVQNANIRKDNAAASNSLASAGLHRVQTQKAQQELERGAKSGDIKEVTGPDGSVYLVNKVTGETRQVVGSDGKPLVSGKAGGAGTGAGKPMTEAQAKANMFGGRMLESDKILTEMEDSGTFRPGAIKTFAEGVAGAVPLIGDSLSEGASALTNWTQSAHQQQVDQARRDFINAVLRRESGAVISPEEFANADKQYFPQMGDSKEVLAQKRRNRQIATTLMMKEVPEAHRYRLGDVPPVKRPAAPPAPAGNTGGATGWSIQRVN